MRSMTQQEFTESIIAQDDDEDYEESGYVAGVLDGVAYIGRYSHCSCYGTFTSLCGGGISDSFTEGTPTFDWTGTVEEMIDMAKREADPAMPTRQASPNDHDYDHLTAVYKAILKWSLKQGPQHPDLLSSV